MTWKKRPRTILWAAVNANFKLNRASTSHHFYGLSDGIKTLRMSGYADSAPQEYSAIDDGLSYAKLACDIAGTADFDIDSIVSLSGRVGDLIDGDQTDMDNTLTAFLSDP